MSRREKPYVARHRKQPGHKLPGKISDKIRAEKIGTEPVNHDNREETAPIDTPHDGGPQGRGANRKNS